VFDRGALGRVRRPRWAYATVAVFAVAGLAVVPLLGSRAMLPAPQDRDLLVELQAVPGTSLTEMARITNRIGREIDAVPGVRDVGLHVGRAVTSDQDVDVDSSEVWLSISRSADYSATVDRVRHVVDEYRGLRHAVTTYEQQQLGAARHGSGRPLVVRVYGQDLPTLRAQAEKVRRSISSVDGVQDPRVEVQPDQPTLQVEVNLARAERAGVRPGDVRRTAATLISGLLAGNLYQEQKVFDVVVWGAPTVRQNLSSVQNLLIDTPGGRQVRLRDVATVRMGPSPAVIRHEDVSRYVDVTADVSGRRLGAVSADVQSTLRSLTYPLEYHAEVLDRHAVAGAGGGGVDGRVLALGVAALLAAFLLMQALTRSWRSATLLLVLVPWGVVGGVLVAPFAGGLLSLGALLGLAAVLAVCVRHSLLLVHHIRTRPWDASGEDDSPVLAATRDQLGPVLLTTLALAAAMLPFAVFGGVAGAEILHPMAVVVLGGLVTATLLTLFVIPALYVRFVGDAQPGPVTVPSQRDARTEETEEAHHAGS
jgi:Cu/Ag efflux pump CusA